MAVKVGSALEILIKVIRDMWTKWVEDAASYYI